MATKRTMQEFLQDPHTAKMQRKATRLAGGIFKFIFLFGFCFVILYPVITMILAALMGKADLSDNSVMYIPKNFTLINMKAASMTLNYGEALKNTGIITLSTTLVQVLSCMLVGYGFARHEFPGKNVLFALVLFTVVIPPILFEIPYFRMFRFFDPLGLGTAIKGEPWNLINTYVPFWILGGTCMGIKNGIFIYLFRQAFKNMPMELEEAGSIDGANSLGIFFRIMVPNAVTMIVTVLLFSFVWQYNDVTYTRALYVGEPSFSTAYSTLYTITNEVKALLGYADGDLSVYSYAPVLKSAGTLALMGPLLLFYAVAQKYFVQGVTRSGIVG